MTEGNGTTPDLRPQQVLQPEIRSLTGLRAIAAMWVVVFHLHFTPADPYAKYWAPFSPLIKSGHLGVDLFYVLSGFVIVHVYLNKVGARFSPRPVLSFLWARVCRVWPAYAVVVNLFGVWLLLRSWRWPGEPIAYQTVQPVLSAWSWLKQMLLVQLWPKPFFDGTSWVGATWSVSAEWLAYCLFPIGALLIYRLRRLPAVVLTTLAFTAMLPMVGMTYFTGTPYFAWSWVLRILLGFLAGALICLAVRRLPKTDRVRQIANWVSIVVLVEIGFILWWADTQQGADLYGVAMLLFPLLVGSLALSDAGPARFLSGDILVHGGRISYSLYLVHVPIFEIFWTLSVHVPRIGPGSKLDTLLVPQLLLVALLAAHLLWRYVEEPARKKLRKYDPGKLRRRTPAPEPEPALARG
ncbi:acyltransferase [Pseudonocardiaceae bacterium YIM PH 21723]|nr:acyltransferase [Pseudonocardiaceae bacterium YIM PH 21723]